MTLDTSAPGSKLGALMSFSFAKEAMQLAELSAEDRKKLVLDALSRRFGKKAAHPIHYFEHDWSTD